MRQIIIEVFAKPIQRISFIMLSLGSIGKDYVINESCCEGSILQRNYRKMTISWSLSYISFAKFHDEKIGP